MAYKREDCYDEQVTAEIAEHVRAVIELLGEDPSREGLENTPERVAKSLQFLTKGYDEDGEEILRQAIFQEEYDEMVMVRDIDLFSLCEHHLLPFIGKCHIAYVPDGEIVGLSKLARLVEVYARRFQVQERLTREICDCFADAVHPKWVGVAIEAQHSCMIMRGVEKPGTMTTTYAYASRLDSRHYKEDFLRALERK